MNGSRNRTGLRAADVARVLKVLRSEGLRPAEIHLPPDGGARILLPASGQVDVVANSSAREIQEELARHFANGRF